MYDPRPGLDQYKGECTGGSRNGFYGAGEVNAFDAVNCHRRGALLLRVPPSLFHSGGQARRDLRNVVEPRRALAQVALEPAQSGLLVLRRAAFRVEPYELERILEWKVGELPSRVLGKPQRAALDRSAEAGVRVRLGGQERMFARFVTGH